MKKSLLVILAAPSGTGKSTICKELIKKNKDWEFSVSVTTRIPRDGEIDGKDYTFISNADFEHNVKFGDFLCTDASISKTTSSSTSFSLKILTALIGSPTYFGLLKFTVFTSPLF